MAGVQYPYNKKIVTNDIDTVEDDDHNKQEEQLEALTNARGGTWADDLARPTPDANNPHPVGYNVSRSNYEFWDGSAWIQLETPVNKGVANGYAPLDGSALVPSIYIPPTAPTAHKTSHELGGSDELDLTGLSGTLADRQEPLPHAMSHFPEMEDPIAPSDIGADTPANRDAAIVVHKSDSAAHHTRPVDFELLPKQHKSSHEQGGTDQMNLTGLLGILGNAQVPLNHKNNHKTGGTDAFVSADVLQARVKRFEDGGGGNWELGALSPNQRLVADAVGNIIGVNEPAGSKHITFPITRTGSYGDYAVSPIASNAQGRFSFVVPDDFNSLVSIKLVGIVDPAAAGAGKDIDILSMFAQHGELYNTNIGADLVTVYDLTGQSNRFWELDLTSIFAAIVAGHHCGIQVDHNSIGGSIYYHAIELFYN